MEAVSEEAMRQPQRRERKGIKISREQDIFHVSDGGMKQDR